MPLEYIAIIASITWLAVISPGADFAVVSRNSSLYGRGAGIASSAGIAAGCWVHVAYAIFGLGLITEFFPNFLGYVQTAGAAYLVYLGIATVRAGAINDTIEENPTDVRHWKHFTTGLLTNSLNPKTSIFVISLYSQVIGESTGLWMQIASGAFISLSHFLWFSTISIFMSTTTIRSWVLRHQRIFNGVIGVLLGLLGVLLFLAEGL